MNITGVTSTMPTIDQQYSMVGQTAPPAPAQEAQPISSETMNVGMQASVQVLDMANSAFEDAASQLIDSMAQMTGVGQNVDISV